MKFFLIYIILNIPNYLTGQAKNVVDFTFLESKIKNVYAGYKDKITEKEFQQLFNETIKSKSKDTFALLSKLTSFFDDHHLSLFEKIKLKDVDTLQCKKNISEVYFNHTKPKLKEKGYEGYWINEVNTIVIYFKKKSLNNYEGYITETNNGMPLGLSIIKFTKNKSNRFVSDCLISSGQSSDIYRVFTKSFFKSKNVLIANSYYKWKKIKTYNRPILALKKEFNFKPSIEPLDSNTTLIRMPTFSGNSDKLYDSLIKLNYDKIRESKTLIIDLRNNGGGTTNGFDNLLPFICNKPLITCGGYVLCSNDIIEEAKSDVEYYKKKNNIKRLNYSNNYLDSLLKYKGNFLYVKEDTINFSSILNNKVKNVALITNNATRSAAELIILYLRGHEKVTVFGENSAGAVDYLDIFTYKLPVSKFVLWVATVKRYLSSSNDKLDSDGLIPNISIPDDVENWIDFVKKYYE